MTRFIVVVDIFMIIEFTFMNRFLLKYLWKLLRCLNSFDKKMATLNAPVNHTLHRKLIIRMMMALMVLYMILGSVNVGAITMISHRKLLLFFVSVTYTIISYAFLFYVSHFIVILMNIKERFRLLNRCFKNHFATNDYYTTVKTSSDESCIFVTALSKLHDSLYDSVSLANSYFAIPMLMALTCVFVYIVVTIFTIYCVCTRSHTETDIWTSLIYGFDCFFYASFMVSCYCYFQRSHESGKIHSDTHSQSHQQDGRCKSGKKAERMVTADGPQTTHHDLWPFPIRLDTLIFNYRCCLCIRNHPYPIRYVKEVN
uniref:Gustatory receptor n=1 Tax=Lutzomyia longipalpis TaxID=7200 RepID=A0A240SY26_LUTLO